MSLEDFFKSETDKNLGEFLTGNKLSKDEIQKIKTKIRQRRSQMLLHSCIYYEMDENIVDDHTWQKWADELAELQRKYPEYCNIKFYDREFYDWTGDSGAFLPLRDSWVYNSALRLLKSCKEYGEIV